MKKRIVQLAALLMVTAGIHAQTEVTAGIMRGKDYGVTYLLPKTEIVLNVQATKHIYTPGEFCKYAERYLRLTDVATESREYWTLDKVQTTVAGVPDKDKVFFVKLKDKTVAPLMELTEDGIVRSINMPYSGGKSTKEQPVEATPEPMKLLDPSTFLTEEIMMANSSAKMAELVAKEIYSIRESKNALLRGEADNTPQDGAQLKLMLDNLNQQEASLVAMFAGQTVSEPQTFAIRITPRTMQGSVAFRFSKKLGVVDDNDLAGEPIYITITDLKTIDAAAANAADGEGKKVDGVAYNVPGRAQVTLTYDHQKLFESELPVTQFGTTEYLAPVLFNKNTLTKVLFDTATGGLLKVDRGE
ncbi:MAG: DUF4831 family protein [Bacteroides sp.]|nr:DUF4831 family protein [Bacteroides sp.]